MCRLAGVVLAVTLLLGCSAQGRAERSPSAAAEPSRPFPSVSRSPFKARPLVDLKRKTRGKVLLFHTDGKAKQIYWTTKVRLGTSFTVAVDCVGPEGELVIQAVGAVHMVRQCIAGYTTYTVDDYPPQRPKAYELVVRAPRGAKWAVLVSRLP